MKKLLLLLLVSALTALLWLRSREDHPTDPPAPLPVSPLTALLSQARESPALKGTVIGVCVIDDQGKVIFESQSRDSFIPASTLKTVTTATALEVFGADYQIATQVKAASKIKDGLISGDVVLVGGGDPTLTLADLTGWARQLREQGLRRIAGRIVGDGRLFTGSLFGDFWNWGDIGNGYGAPVSGLNLEHNRYTAWLQSGETLGAPARLIKTAPEVPGIQWANEISTGTADSGDGTVLYGGERTSRIFLRGTVPLNKKPFTVTGAVPDPERFTAYHFDQALRAAGIEITGQPIPAPLNYDSAKAGETLIEHRSPPLKEIVTSIHATSDNQETQCLFLLLGLKSNEPPQQAIRNHWQKRGLHFEGLRMEDGCGLARADFIRPQDLAMLQWVTKQGEQGEVYRDSLLTSRNETLKWKAGAMSGIRSYTGYLQHASGKELSFAIMFNHFSDSKAIAELRDQLIEAMSTLPIPEAKAAPAIHP